MSLKIQIQNLTDEQRDRIAGLCFVVGHFEMTTSENPLLNTHSIDIVVDESTVEDVGNILTYAARFITSDATSQ